MKSKYPLPLASLSLQPNTNVVSTPMDDGTTIAVIVNPPVGNRFYRLPGGL